MVPVASRKVSLATLLIVALMTFLGSSSPALAHESVTDQFPAAGETINAGVIDLRISFSGDLLVLADASGIELEITDPSGERFRLSELGCLVVGQRSIAATLELEQVGTYLVTWQVTAGDGHPLSESFSFAVENPLGFVAEVPLSELDCAGNRLPDGSVVGGNSDSSNPVAGTTTNTLLAILLAIALALVAVLTFLLLKPKQNRANRN